MANSIHKHKQFIWNMLKSGKWTRQHILSLKPINDDESWNLALNAAQQWVSSQKPIIPGRPQDPLKKKPTARRKTKKETSENQPSSHEKREKEELISQIKSHRKFKRNMASKLPGLALHELENLNRMLIASMEKIEPGGSRYNTMQHRLDSSKDSTKWHARANKSRGDRS